MDIPAAIGTVAAVITGLTVIITALIKFSKFTSAIQNKITFLDDLEEKYSNKFISSNTEGTQIEHNEQIISDFKELKKQLSQLYRDMTDLRNNVDKTLRLTKALRDDNEKERELLIQETRDHLLIRMNQALENGGVESVDEIGRIGDLFSAYEQCGGNHGVHAVFEKYKRLKLLDDDIELKR